MAAKSSSFELFARGCQMDRRTETSVSAVLSAAAAADVIRSQRAQFLQCQIPGCHASLFSTIKTGRPLLGQQSAGDAGLQTLTSANDVTLEPFLFVRAFEKKGKDTTQTTPQVVCKELEDKVKTCW